MWKTATAIGSGGDGCPLSARWEEIQVRETGCQTTFAHN